MPGIDLRAARRFGRYASVGVSTFLLDLALLFALVDGFGIDPVPAAGLAFLIAVSLNFLISRRVVFKGTKRPPWKSYGAFLLIAGTGALAVAGLMHVAVDVLGLGYLGSRVLIAGVVGVFNYLMNLHFNFRVAGQHE